VPAVPTAPTDPAPLGSRARLRVLLAEDNPVNQKLTVRLLESHGHSVVVVENGREALAMLAQQSFDVVLMDVQMPEMDGFAATARIRQQEQGTGQHLPIIALTAHALKGDQERCLAAGMDDYISKPFQPEDFYEVLARAVPPDGRPGQLAEAPGCPLYSGANDNPAAARAGSLE